MDSLKTLMDKKEYELVIKLTENSEDSLALFYRITALIATNQSKRALDAIKEKRKFMREHLALLVKMHIELLCIFEKFDEAYDELKIYQELPYENQETEELLKDMSKYIRQEERKLYARREVGQDEIVKNLLSNDDNAILAALDNIRNLPLEPFIPTLASILKNHPRQAIRSFTLFLLLAKKYDKPINFLHFDKLIKVVPSQLDEPFTVPGFSDTKLLSMALQNTFHDPSVTQNAIQLISSYLIYIYPDKLLLEPKEVIVIFGYLAKAYLGSEDNDLEALCANYHLDPIKIRKIAQEIKERLNDF